MNTNITIYFLQDIDTSGKETLKMYMVPNNFLNDIFIRLQHSIPDERDAVYSLFAKHLEEYRVESIID